MKKIILILLCGVFALAFDQNVSSLKADFVQYAKNPKGDMGVYYSGSLMALAPHFAKWEYAQPVKKIVYLNGKNLISYEPMLSQAVYMGLEKSVDFLQIIRTAKPNIDDPNLYIARINGIEYALHTKDSLPQKVEYEDELGNHITIELKNVSINTKIPKQIFDFSLPKGVDVIKQ